MEKWFQVHGSQQQIRLESSEAGKPESIKLKAHLSPNQGIGKT
jgi:hypothetical protein